MENQDNFLSNSDAFGVESTSTVSEDIANLIFNGGSTSANAADAKPIDEQEKDEEKPNLMSEEHGAELDAEDLLNAIEEKKEPEVVPDPKKETATEKIIDPENPGEEGVSKIISDEADTFTTLSKNLTDMGVFKTRDGVENPKTSEEFAQRWQLEVQDQVNDNIYNYLMSKHGEEGVKVFQDIFVNGVTPKEYMERYSEIQTFEGLDLTVEENQRKVFREAYRRQGLAEDKIEKKLQRTIDYGDLEDEVGDLYEIITTQDREELEQMSQSKAQAEQAVVASKQQYANNMQTILSDKLKEKEFDGIPVTDKVARETYDYLVTEKWQLPNGDKLTDFDKDVLELRDPKNHELKLKLALLLRNKLDLSKIKIKAITNETNKLFGDLVNKEKVIKRQTSIIPSRSFSDGL